MTKLFLSSLLLPALALAHEYGPDPGYNLAPATRNEGVFHPMACATAMCHSNDQSQTGKGGPINTGGGAVMATFSTGSTYTPGGPPISITVMVTDPNAKNNHYGFQMTARLESDLANGQAGTFNTGTTASCPPSDAPCELVICDDGSPRLPGKKCPASAPVEYIEHAFSKNAQVSTTPYTFTWTPPATNVGMVHFYLAGNAVNGDLMASGLDHVYTTEYTLTPPLCSGAAPTVGGVVSATDFGQLPNFASGSWIEIYGTKFASNFWQWEGIDFNGAVPPTSIAGGISVSINGNPAYTWFVSPGQINALAPADATNGSVKVTVSSCGSTSASFTAQKTALAPGLLAPASFMVNGKQYLEAIFNQDGITRVGNTNLVPNLPFKPAKPGDILVFYGVGFGDVKAADGSSVPIGTVASGLTSLVNPVTINFGTTPATILYQGLTPNLVGLYQFTLTVPNVANGDLPINVTQNGTALKQQLYLTIHN